MEDADFVEAVRKLTGSDPDDFAIPDTDFSVRSFAAGRTAEFFGRPGILDAFFEAGTLLEYTIRFAEHLGGRHGGDGRAEATETFIDLCHLLVAAYGEEEDAAYAVQLGIQPLEARQEALRPLSTVPLEAVEASLLQDHLDETDAMIQLQIANLRLSLGQGFSASGQPGYVCWLTFYPPSLVPALE